MLASPGLWALLGYGYWVAERREDGFYLGQVGFADFKRDMIPSIEGIPEMGWIFAPHGQGQGYAFEAVIAALGWADRALRGREIVAIIDPDNARSIRLAEKAGFSSREDAVYKSEPILLFRRPPPA
jgi:RimJ/RimL family protein N-acetyltransferase